jgi:tetratricopeptide (TPR) repeat protein
LALCQGPVLQNLFRGTRRFGDWRSLRARKEPQPARRLFEEALGHYRAVLKVNPRHPDYRRFFRNDLQALAETLIDLGEHASAANMAAELIQAAVDPANDFYNAACVLSLCIPLAERDAQSLAGSYGERALATLRQAVQQGFKDWKHMKKDKDLDPLRSRGEFQKLVAELEGSNQRLQVP